MSKEFERLVGGEEASITAAHEAGHALLAYLSPAIERVRGTVLLRDEEADTGRVRVLFDHRLPVTAYTLWEYQATSSAGIAAELITHLRFKTRPARGDLDAMKAGAQAIVAGSPGRPCSPWPAPGEAKAPPFGRYFKDPPDEHATEVMRLGYLRARELILKHRGPYERLRTAMIAKIELSGDEIAEALRLPKG